MARTKEKVRKGVLEYTYTAVFEPAEEGGYVVHVPALNGAATQGETLQEARKRAKDLILRIIEASIEIERPIPREDVDIEGEKIAVQCSVL